MEQQRRRGDEAAKAVRQTSCSSTLLNADSLEGTMAGTYRIQALLGLGATSSVYLGQHPHIGAQVAIKVLHQNLAGIPGMGERFVREARASNMVDSPYVLRIHDFGKLDDGRDYAVMDALRGLPLDVLLESEGSLPLPRALRLLMQAASGLAAAHDAGVLHRDIKPGNLFVTERPDGEHVFILDFGIAKLLAAPPSSANQTAVGSLVGTPGYCAPEQIGPGPVGPPADVYALGCVAYEVLTGRQVFTGATIVELLADKIRAERAALHALPNNTPAALSHLLERMLLRAPEARPEMRKVEATLRALFEATSGSTVPHARTPCNVRRPAPPPPEYVETLASGDFCVISPAGMAPTLPSIESRLTPTLTPRTPGLLLGTGRPPASPPGTSYPPVTADSSPSVIPPPEISPRPGRRPHRLALGVSLAFAVVVSFFVVRWVSSPTQLAAGQKTTFDGAAAAVPLPRSAPAPASSAKQVARATTPSAQPSAVVPRTPPRLARRSAATTTARTSPVPGPVGALSVQPPTGLVDPFRDEPVPDKLSTRR